MFFTCLMNGRMYPAPFEIALLSMNGNAENPETELAGKVEEAMVEKLYCLEPGIVAKVVLKESIAYFPPDEIMNELIVVTMIQLFQRALLPFQVKHNELFIAFAAVRVSTGRCGIKK
jgi:hypothetical protein